MPDEWIRQMLNRLPDAPPPGSSFDSERLWTQLRPELQQAPVHRRIGWAWWAAAACLTGLALSPLLWNQPVKIQKQVATYGRIQSSEKPTAGLQKHKVIDKITLSEPVLAAKSGRKLQHHNSDNQKDSSNQPFVTPASEPVEMIAMLPEPTTLVNLPSVTEKLPESHKTNVVTGTSKRRFRVMHENELRAEEEAAPKLYRTDNFVRLGTGQRDSDPSDSRQPTLIMPLTTKSNQ